MGGKDVQKCVGGTPFLPICTVGGKTGGYNQWGERMGVSEYDINVT